MVRNEVARDTRLSFRARGVLVAILSRPDDWSISAENLAREGQESVQTIYKVLRELESAGYVRRRRARNERGQIRTETLVYDEPTDKKPSDGEPMPGETDSRVSVSVTKTDKQKQNTKTEGQNGDALRIAQGWWDQQQDKPITPFPALLKIIASALKAGYAPERVEQALARFNTVPSKQQLELAMKNVKAVAQPVTEEITPGLRRALEAAANYRKGQA